MPFEPPELGWQVGDVVVYRCRDCGRTFNALTGTPLARLRHKETWLTFGEALQNADSVRKSAKACGVAVTTAFRWRHRFLCAAKADKPTKLGGIVEADETFFDLFLYCEYTTPHDE